jgi:hypothetical protein
MPLGRDGAEGGAQVLRRTVNSEPAAMIAAPFGAVISA